MFDVDAFVGAKVEGATSSEYAVVPEKNDVPMRVGSGNPRDWFRSFESQKDGKTYHTVEIPMLILDEEIKAALGRDQVMSRYKFFLDLKDDGSLDDGPNKNVKLGKLREALGQNDPAKPWSWNDLVEAGPLLGRIKHRNGSDGATYDEVAAVAPMGGASGGGGLL